MGIIGIIQDAGVLGLILFLLVLTISISVHEFSHALSAYLQGDNTAKYEGRLTLNPVAHLDVMGSLMLVLVGFGWGKPVPFNPYNLKYQKWGPVLVALAGPAANFILFLLSGMAYRVLLLNFGFNPNNLLIVFLFIFGLMNLGLMFFNLIPIPPLDGSKLLDIIVPDRYFQFKQNIFRYGPSALLFLVFLDMIMGVSVFGWLGTLIQTVFYWLF